MKKIDGVILSVCRISGFVFGAAMARFLLAMSYGVKDAEPYAVPAFIGIVLLSMSMSIYVLSGAEARREARVMKSLKFEMAGERRRKMAKKYRQELEMDKLLRGITEAALCENDTSACISINDIRIVGGEES